MTSAEPSLGTAVRRSKEASLARLFVDLHGSSAALRCFVLQLASGKRILDELRDDSLAQMGHELVLLLDRRNRINDALFQVLLSDHPGARSAIVEVAEKWGVPGGRLRPTWSDRALTLIHI